MLFGRSGFVKGESGRNLRPGGHSDVGWCGEVDGLLAAVRGGRERCYRPTRGR